MQCLEKQFFTQNFVFFLIIVSFLFQLQNAFYSQEKEKVSVFSISLSILKFLSRLAF